MCRYCEARDVDGEECVDFLPTPDFAEEYSRQTALGESDGEWYILSAGWPADFAGPIRYCPMCGRKLN